MVQAEQVGEFLGVLGPAFHGVEQGELLVQEYLAAAREVDEDLGDARAEFGLFDGGFHGGPLEGVEGLADLADLVPVVFEARHLGLDVDLLARRQAAHHAGQPDAGRLVGLQAQLLEVADERAADADGQEQGVQQGDQTERPGDDCLCDGAGGDGVDAILVAVGGVVVEFAEFLEDVPGRGVPALGGDSARRAGAGGDGGLLGDPEGGGGGVLPEALVAAAFGGGQQRQVDVVHHGALRDEVGDLPDLRAGEPPGDQGGAEEGVLAGEQFPGARDVDERAVLLVQPHVVDDVEVGEQVVAGVDQAVVEAEGLGAVDGAVLDAAAQGAEAVEGVQDGGEPFLTGLAEVVPHVGVGGVATDLRDGLVGGGPAAPQGGEAVGGAGVGEVDEGLAAFLLEDADGVLDRVADLLDDVGDAEQPGRLTARQHRGEGPDRGQGHQRHEEQRHDLPADRLPAKAHGLPQLDPHRRGGTHVRQQTARAYY
ncbi:hypothetical protein RKD40_006244 [Streptomyces ambofaciens]